MIARLMSWLFKSREADLGPLRQACENRQEAKDRLVATAVQQTLLSDDIRQLADAVVSQVGTKRADHKRPAP
jgi:hypothetical protein